jgi:L-fuculose-phosphate aldolase
MESVEFYAQRMYQAKVLGGPKKLTDAQVERLYEIRRQFGLKGKHPANLCPNAKSGLPSCHTCGNTICGSIGAEASGSANNDLVAEITKKVMEQLGK